MHNSMNNRERSEFFILTLNRGSSVKGQTDSKYFCLCVSQVNCATVPTIDKYKISMAVFQYNFIYRL